MFWWWIACAPHEDPDLDRGCVVEESRRWCGHETIQLSTGALSRRDVHFALPRGEVPDHGWPAAVLFQGSLHPAARFWEADLDGAFGAWHQTATVQALLEAGVAVITPDAQLGGHSFWNTNVLPWSLAWETSPDHRLVQALLEAIGDGTLGPIDAESLYAAGISSGGYMTSRMALSYPGAFARLAIQSASWATCSGPVCVLPEALPADHPPTLFLHGEADDVVPIGTMQRYHDRLVAEGHTTSLQTDPAVGHAWLDRSPDAVVAWFTEPDPEIAGSGRR